MRRVLRHVHGTHPYTSGSHQPERSPIVEGSTMTESPQYYFNTTTGQVEEGPQSPATELMGPYATREEAQQAFSIAQKRNEAWDEEERAWEDDGQAPA